ncbi:aminoglycoside phosphotransferase family protein [Streptomyces heilongjiangensis]|uniref:Aminoglycoside phosphotransferase family protein n=1 Tax=Streptomyces heilongjiangensis TaxID=945052 RepID=A0ABW1BHU7_9ACTN|nr:phosphotransferase [Streptomyces heilongjiangensis]MDC2951374.1 phosphotransferase [Streptomyces heilongjiangensis]
MPGAPRTAYDDFVRRAEALGPAGRDRHHVLHTVRTPTEADRRLLGCEAGQSVTVRRRVRSALPLVVRTWQDEAEILRAVHRCLPYAPRCLVRHRDLTVLAHVPGVPLSAVRPDGTPLDARLIRGLAGLMADLTRVRRKELPPLPQSWPRSSRDSRAFLRALALAAEEQVRRRNAGTFGGLFATLGIPDDALLRFAERVPAMTGRPFGLLHTDLRRGNVIVPDDGDAPLVCVDWEPATYGDPLHDLATHLVRTRYPSEQWGAVTDAWAEAVGRRQSGAADGLDRDLGHYLAFERARSLHPDVMRAATSLGDSFDERALDEATRAVHRALVAAEEPLRLRRVPDERAIERVLFRWSLAHRGRHGRERAVSAVLWERDPRVPEHRRFPASAVREALFEEGAASADRVFRGTAHLSTAVRVSGFPRPVMVRRKVGTAAPRERRFLNEHAVLRAVERSCPRVRAPRVLALGTSALGDRFTIHSYEGPAGTIRHPDHPVHGLLPHEADDLVDQLAELTRAECGELDPDASLDDFYPRLCDELIRMVAELPGETIDLARELGLPGSGRLGELLRRHLPVPRRQALLHGDLNPWNLVRREDGAGLTLIDWEMAMVGDPLYDLVRHMHLTPTLADIRERMFSRWSRLLPEECTKGWKDDWRVYRWIETVRSAYVDLDRLVTGDGLEAPNVRRAVDGYAMTLTAATAGLGLHARAHALHGGPAALGARASLGARPSAGSRPSPGAGSGARVPA